MLDAADRHAPVVAVEELHQGQQDVDKALVAAIVVDLVLARQAAAQAAGLCRRQIGGHVPGAPPQVRVEPDAALCDELVGVKRPQQAAEQALRLLRAGGQRPSAGRRQPLGGAGEARQLALQPRLPLGLPLALHGQTVVDGQCVVERRRHSVRWRGQPGCVRRTRRPVVDGQPAVIALVHSDLSNAQVARAEGAAGQGRAAAGRSIGRDGQASGCGLAHSTSTLALAWAAARR